MRAPTTGHKEASPQWATREYGVPQAHPQTRERSSGQPRWATVKNPPASFNIPPSPSSTRPGLSQSIDTDPKRHRQLRHQRNHHRRGPEGAGPRSKPARGRSPLGRSPALNGHGRARQAHQPGALFARERGRIQRGERLSGRGPSSTRLPKENHASGRCYGVLYEVCRRASSHLPAELDALRGRWGVENSD